MTRTIDSHQHFWALATGEYDWLDGDGLDAIRHDVGPDDLRPLLEAHNVDATIAVQAAPTTGDTERLLALADVTPWIAGVVGWVDLQSPDAIEKIQELARHPRLCGLRPMLQDDPDAAWIVEDSVAPAIKRMIDLNLVFDALVRASQLPLLARLAQRFPELRIVLDHAGKPPIASTNTDEWKGHIVRLAGHPNVACKLSGLWTESGGDCRDEVIGAVIEVLVAAFGTSRLLWGSDWPVLELAGQYGTWHDQTRRLVPNADAAAIFGGNAKRIYRLR